MSQVISDEEIIAYLDRAVQRGCTSTNALRDVEVWKRKEIRERHWDRLQEIMQNERFQRNVLMRAEAERRLPVGLARNPPYSRDLLSEKGFIFEEYSKELAGLGGLCPDFRSKGACCFEQKCKKKHVCEIVWVDEKTFAICKGYALFPNKRAKINAGIHKEQLEQDRRRKRERDADDVADRLERCKQSLQNDRLRVEAERQRCARMALESASHEQKLRIGRAQLDADQKKDK